MRRPDGIHATQGRRDDQAVVSGWLFFWASALLVACVILAAVLS